MIIISQARLIEQLQRRAFGDSLKERAIKYDGPSLFDDVDEQAALAAKKELEKASKNVDQATKKRRRRPRRNCKAEGNVPVCSGERIFSARTTAEPRITHSFIHL